MQGKNSTSIIHVDLEGQYSSQVTKAFNDVDAEIDRMNRQGYKVVSVTPLTGSSYDNSEHQSYAQSFTIGILIVFEAME